MQITLAKKAYDLPEEFTLGQIRKISTKVAALIDKQPDSEKRADLVWSRRLDITAIALQTAWPDVTASVLEALPISNDEIMKAYADILEHAGLVPKRDEVPGEAIAEMGSNGAASTGA